VYFDDEINPPTQPTDNKKVQSGICHNRLIGGNTSVGTLKLYTHTHTCTHTRAHTHTQRERI